MSTSARAWVLSIAQAMVLAIFFYCAEMAKDLYVEIAEFHEFDASEDLRLSFIEWHTYAREAVWAVVALWIAAIILAVSQQLKAKTSFFESPRPNGSLMLALGLPVGGMLGGFIFDMFLPGL